MIASCDNVLIRLRDDTVKRTIPIYESAFTLTTSRYAATNGGHSDTRAEV